jgi:hypothetical protein
MMPAVQFGRIFHLSGTQKERHHAAEKTVATAIRNGYDVEVLSADNGPVFIFTDDDAPVFRHHFSKLMQHKQKKGRVLKKLNALFEKTYLNPFELRDLAHQLLGQTKAPNKAERTWGKFLERSLAVVRQRKTSIPATEMSNRLNNGRIHLKTRVYQNQ